MGGTFSIYGRRKNNDSYIIVEQNVEKPFNVFKHNVAAYALDKKHTNLKSIYLYHGYFREAKAIVRNGYLEITFYSTKIAEKWDTAEEELNDIAWLFRDFTRTWKPVHTDFAYKRVYQKI